MTAKGNRTRRARETFDAKPYAEAIGAKPLVASLWSLPGGQVVSLWRNKPGKVTVTLHGKDEAPSKSRTFGAKQFEEIREWVASGGTIFAEEQMKRMRSAAAEMYDALRVAESTLGRVEAPDDDPDYHPALDVVRAAIAKAEGK